MAGTIILNIIFSLIIFVIRIQPTDREAKGGLP